MRPLKVEARIVELESAIRKHRDQKRDDRCWLDDLELYKVLNEPVPKGANSLPSRAKFLANCAYYYDNRCVNGNWPSYQDLLDKIKELEDRLKRRIK